MEERSDGERAVSVLDGNASNSSNDSNSDVPAGEQAGIKEIKLKIDRNRKKFYYDK